MKKIFLASSLSALMLSMIACNGNCDAPTCENNAFNDSITTYLATVNGGSMSMAMERDPQAASFDKKSVVRGIQTALLADTADMGYVQGLAIGANMARQFKSMNEQIGVNIDRNDFLNAFKEAFFADSLPNLEEDQHVLQALMIKAQDIAEEKRNAALENSPESVANKEAGAKYIAEAIKNDPSIKTTESGLAYKIIKEGKGETVKESDQVQVVYTGKLIDGTVFDDSKGEARTFSPRGVIPGFREGLLLMNKGAKYTLYIPGNIAYGVKGQPMAEIGPNATLIFEVEVVGINEKKK